MKKLFIPLLTGCLCVSFTYKTSTGLATTANIFSVTELHTDSYSKEADAIFEQAGLEQVGLSHDAFEYAWKGYHRLIKLNMIKQQRFLTICDFSQSSKNKRIYIIDVENAQLVKNTFVAHGRNSGEEYATKFSNKPESLQTSLGFYITDKTYTGAHGLSLRLKGVDGGYNNNAYTRSIVIHGAVYVDGKRVSQGLCMGRSWGCPALPQNEAASIINLIKEGSCLFIYHPGNNYLKGSTILNG